LSKTSPELFVMDIRVVRYGSSSIGDGLLLDMFGLLMTHIRLMCLTPQDAILFWAGGWTAAVLEGRRINADELL
jgi:hypothetical protein